MSARDDLIFLIEVGLLQEAPAEDVADEILNLHAHELAEKIRNSKRLRDYTDDHMSDMYEAANEIDPGVGK